MVDEAPGHPSLFPPYDLVVPTSFPESIRRRVGTSPSDPPNPTDVSPGPQKFVPPYFATSPTPGSRSPDRNG